MHIHFFWSTCLKEPLHNLVSCEERSDAAIHNLLILFMKWIASLRSQ